MKLVVKNPPASAGDMRCGFNPWVGKVPWRRKWQHTRYSCLENPMERGAWRATVYSVTKSQTRLCAHTHQRMCCYTFTYARQAVSSSGLRRALVFRWPRPVPPLRGAWVWPLVWARPHCCSWTERPPRRNREWNPTAAAESRRSQINIFGKRRAAEVDSAPSSPTLRAEPRLPWAPQKPRPRDRRPLAVWRIPAVCELFHLTAAGEEGIGWQRRFTRAFLCWCPLEAVLPPGDIWQRLWKCLTDESFLQFSKFS